MSELLNVRCSKGRLIITESAIIVELKLGFGRKREESMFRQSLTGIKKTGSFAPRVAFHGQGGQILDAGVCSAQDIKAVSLLLTGRE